ncbi:MAG: S41 family peptidase [Catonella sp.]|uniref:S41 family peptidase n=1 Tax=Catonella sp. TaxID=2382125 RepID=UPI003FA0D0ED
MKENKKFFIGVLVGIIVTAVFVAGFVKLAFESRLVRGLLFDTVKKVSLITDEAVVRRKDTTTGAAIDWNEVEKKSAEIYDAIDHYYLNEIDNNKLKDGMYKGLTDSLGDPYTVYYNAEEFEEFNTSSSGTYCGIGVVVSQNASTGAITVVKTFKKGSGEEEGMLAGDIIYKVGGEKIAGLELSKVVAKIKGEEGTLVKVTVLRNGKEIEFNLERRKLEIDTVNYRMEEKEGKKIGYIAVTEFDEVTASQFKEAIDSLEKDGMQGLVVDLRDNPGGLLDVTCEMLDRMIKKGLLVYTVDKSGKRIDEEATDDLSFDKPVVILVNGNSASASEVFSGAMKDYKAATLVGTKTFGKGIVQSIVPFGDGTAMKVTVSKYYTPNGINIHGRGIEPDIVEELDKEALKDGKLERNEDNQLEKALDIVKDKLNHLR